MVINVIETFSLLFDFFLLDSYIPFNGEFFQECMLLFRHSLESHCSPREWRHDIQRNDSQHPSDVMLWVSHFCSYYADCRYALCRSAHSKIISCSLLLSIISSSLADTWVVNDIKLFFPLSLTLLTNKLECLSPVRFLAYSVN